ncbi:MAG TPA: 16S rRNA (cytosine(1402)-N(4))-methyltransferase RsmH [Actinomycetota bacterium]
MDSAHRPVLVHEVVELMANKRLVIDATTGAGGHAEALLESGVERVIGLDRDATALEEASTRLGRFGDRFKPVQSKFSRLAEASRSAGAEEAGGVLFDLGVSSMQLDRPSRGFSYRSEGPLDMRMGEDDDLTAADVVNTYSEEALVGLISEFGEERFAGRIASAIVRARSRKPIASTSELSAIVAGAVPRRRKGAHPARRTFQAIRVEVNRELEELTASLPQAVSILEPMGRLVVISYHSLEDRIVKRFLREADRISILTPKPMRPREAERAANPRARSARLRAAERGGEAA